MIRYVSAVMNPALHERCQSLVPWTIEAHLGFTPTGFCDLALFGDFLQGNPPDWIVNTDEDCFCYNPQQVSSLIQYMQENNYDLCGVPEGGVVSHRHYDPLTMNMSFTIANVAKFRQWRSEFHPNKYVFEPGLAVFAPFPILRYPYMFGNYEPTYPWFYFLLKKGAKFLYLNAQMDEDNTSCHIIHDGHMFAAHAFFARAYNRTPEVKDRIDRLFNKCQRLRGNYGDL